MKYLKRLVTMLIIIGLIANFTGCSSKSSNDESTMLKGTINIWASGNDVSYLIKCRSEYIKKYPEVKINVIDTEIDSQLVKFLTIKDGSAGCPDILIVPDEYTGEYIFNTPDKFMDVSELSELNIENIFQKRIDNLKVDKKIFGLPWYNEPVVMIYRKDLLSSLKTDSSEIKTWYDYIQLGNDINKKSQIKLISLNLKEISGIYKMMLDQLDASFFDDKGNYEVNSANNMEISKMVQTIFDNNYNLNVNSYEQIIDNFINGKTASMICTPSSLSVIQKKASNLKGKISVEKLPAFVDGGNRDVCENGKNFFINAKTKNKEACVSFLNYVASDNSIILKNFSDNRVYVSDNIIYKSNDYYPQDKYFSEKTWYLIADVIRQSNYMKYNYKYTTTLKTVGKMIYDVVINKKNVENTLNELQKQLMNEN